MRGLTYLFWVGLEVDGGILLMLTAACFITGCFLALIWFSELRLGDGFTVVFTDSSFLAPPLTTPTLLPQLLREHEELRRNRTMSSTTIAAGATAPSQHLTLSFILDSQRERERERERDLDE